MTKYQLRVRNYQIKRQLQSIIIEELLTNHACYQQKEVKAFNRPVSKIVNTLPLWQKHGLKKYAQRTRREIYIYEMYISIFHFTLLMFYVISTKQISRFKPFFANALYVYKNIHCKYVDTKHICACINSKYNV